MNGVRHKVFISYHHDDQAEVEEFCNTFHYERDVCITRALGVGLTRDIIDKTDTDYVMRQIRNLHLKNSTVTIVLIGKCSWARKYIDWEIQASLRHGDVVTPNGLIGIVLPSAGKHPRPPERLSKNLKGDKGDEGYARWYWYPQRKDQLANWLDDAFQARISRARLIENPRNNFKYNRNCQ